MAIIQPEGFRRIEVITENENQLRAARELIDALELNPFELALLTSSLRVRPEFDLEYLERHYSSNRVSLKNPSCYIISGAECGRDKNGVFHCKCGKCTISTP